MRGSLMSVAIVAKLHRDPQERIDQGLASRDLQAEQRRRFESVKGLEEPHAAVQEVNRAS